MQVERPTRPASLLMFWAAVLGTFSLFFIPAFIIRPFKYQAPFALSMAMALKRYAPVLTLILAVVALCIALVIWKQSSILRRVFVVIGLILACGSATMARMNYFEWMFHPIVSPGFHLGEQRETWMRQRWLWQFDSATTRALIQLCRWPTTTYSMMRSAVLLSSSLIERSVTPVWCGKAR